jgi:ribosomal protein S8
MPRHFGVEDVPTVLGGLGTSILTTSRGVTGWPPGGRRHEVLCTVW